LNVFSISHILYIHQFFTLILINFQIEEKLNPCIIFINKFGTSSTIKNRYTIQAFFF